MGLIERQEEVGVKMNFGQVMYAQQELIKMR